MNGGSGQSSHVRRATATRPQMLIGVWQTSFACCCTPSNAATTAGSASATPAASMRSRSSSVRSAGRFPGSYAAGSTSAAPERVVQLGQRVQERLPVVADVLGRLLLEVAEDRQRLEQRRRRPGRGHVGELGLVLLHRAAVVVAATTGQQRGRAAAGRRASLTRARRAARRSSAGRRRAWPRRPDRRGAARATSWAARPRGPHRRSAAGRRRCRPGRRTRERGSAR